MKISKRVVRIPDSTQCIEFPVDVNLPRPQINLDFDPVRYIKSVPKFNQRFFTNCDIFQLSRDCKQNNNLVREFIKNEMDEFSEDETPDDANRQFSDSILVGNEDQYPNSFIHYCLFIFHGIYKPSKIIEMIKQKEFQVRILMLNYRIKEAFSLCLSDTRDAQQAIKTFEYFTKDSNVVPIHREDLKFLIYELFMHFIDKQFLIDAIEQFFMKDLDYYLFALAYVLYFNNNNTDVERQVLVKYADLFGDDLDYNVASLEKSELIFKAVSITFKTNICQRLLNYEDNFA